MHIQDRTQIPFQSVYRSGAVKAVLRNNPTKEFKSDLGFIERNIRKENLHKKEHADIILCYTESDGFYGIISNKQKETPLSSESMCKISKNEEPMSAFKNWVNMWNDRFRPPI